MAAAAAVIDHAAWRPRHNPWLIAFIVTLATFMEVLDTSIANIALPHIAGSFGASTNESTWVLTSYLVSNGIVLPTSAWLATRIGRKRFYMSCVALFAGSSFLCGFAPTLGMLVFFRVLQGMGGGGLQPSEQSILADTFTPQQRGMAFSIYAMAVVLAPAIGPTIGGWITDNYSWRWIFYINVPISIISLYLTYQFVEDPPYLKEERIKAIKGGIDYVGLGLVALGVGCLQMVMDKGQELDWFGSHWITAGSIAAFVILVVWAIWEWRHSHPIVELKLLKKRNFATAMFSMVMLGSVLYGTTVLLPEFLQNLLGYTAAQAGECMALGGFLMMVDDAIVRRPQRKDGSAILIGVRIRRNVAGAIPHGDPFESGHRLRDGSDAAHLPGGRPGIHFHSLECAVLRRSAAREIQPSFEHDEFRPQHWRGSMPPREYSFRVTSYVAVMVTGAAVFPISVYRTEFPYSESRPL